MERVETVAETSEAGGIPISVIIPAYNAAAYLRVCLESLSKSTVPYECIVVDDGSEDDTVAVAQSFGVQVLHTDKRSGPAHARNLGAKVARANILYFIDADVCVYPTTLDRILENFRNEPDIVGVIGSYDDSPERKDFLSQYKNLLHFYTHQRGKRQACTFWSGCGAIRKQVFLEYSGFDESYRRPAIEDIELGYRLARDGRKVILDTDLLVKHLKAWSFVGLVRTDIFQRGIPWTELILRDKCLPNDLNLQLSQRVSVMLAYLLIGIAAAGAVYAGAPFVLPLLALLFLLLGAYEAESTWKQNPKAIVGTIVLGAGIVLLSFASRNYTLVPPVLLAYLLLFLRHRYAYTSERRRRMTGVFCGVYLAFVGLFVLTYLPSHPLVFAFFLVFSVLVALNSQFYVFLAGRTGRLLALAAIPFHVLFHFYNGVSFIVGVARHMVHRHVLKKQAPRKGAVAPAHR
jgi:glycosyltransferase involved in cell wall biosynthesis